MGDGRGVRSIPIREFDQPVRTIVWCHPLWASVGFCHETTTWNLPLIKWNKLKQKRRGRRRINQNRIRRWWIHWRWQWPSLLLQPRHHSPLMRRLAPPTPRRCLRTQCFVRPNSTVIVKINFFSLSPLPPLFSLSYPLSVILLISWVDVSIRRSGITQINSRGVAYFGELQSCELSLV